MANLSPEIAAHVLPREILELILGAAAVLLILGLVELLRSTRRK